MTTTRYLLVCLLGAAVGCDNSSIPPATLPGVATGASAAGASGAPAKGGSAGAGGAAGTRKPKPMDASVVPQSDEDGGVATRELAADGQGCSSDGDCASTHCDHGLCCGGGECCLETPDCKAEDGIAQVCDYSSSCQGSRGEVMCSDFRCVVADGEPDDTGCDEDLEADDCGPYASVYCTGEVVQRAPHCVEACDSDTQCDRDAVCSDGACVRETGSAPGCERNSQCPAGRRCLAGACVAPGATDAGAGGRAGTGSGAPGSCMPGGAGGDACNACACSECADTSAACMNSGDAERDRLCTAVVDCALADSCIDSMDCQTSLEAASMPSSPERASQAYTLGCFGRYCYCETDLCIAPTGACIAQMRAAAGDVTDSNVISARLRDPAYAVSYAEDHAECLQRSCAVECGL